MKLGISNTWIRITTPYFVAGAELDDDRKIVRCAPILMWMKRKDMNLRDIMYYCHVNPKYRLEVYHGPVERVL